MLTDVGHRGRVTTSELPEIANHMGGQQLVARLLVHDVAALRLQLPLADLSHPLVVRRPTGLREELCEHLLEIADDPQVDLHVLVDLRRIDLDVDLLRGSGVGLESARHAIVEPHTEGEQEVCLLDRIVHVSLTMHAHHAEAEWVMFGDRTLPEQSQRDRHLRGFGEGLKL